MKKSRKLRLRRNKDAVLWISREALKAEKICYVAVANRRVNYPHRRSRIVYIGTSARGHKRILESAKDRAEKAFGSRPGVTDIEFYIVSCTGRKRVPSWEALERALILLFKRLYGTIPIVSIRGKGNVERWQRDLDRFNESTLRRYLQRYDE
jgi:hypothetical protein